MEFEKEFIEKIQLNDEQISALSTHVDDYINNQKDTAWKEEWSKTANEQAEGILSGAWKKVETLTGIQRNQGEKYADAIQRASELYFEGTKNSLARKQEELEKKLENTKGDELLKQELQETKEQIIVLKQKEAEFDEWKDNDYKGKYEKATQDLTSMQRKVAFSSIKPSFPDTVNTFEAKAKWNDFQKEVEEKYNIVLDEDNEPWGVDKENEFKKVKLSELVTKNEALTELLKGRTQTGTGAKPKENIKIDGVPFEVPKEATAKERQTAIKEYLASQNITPTSAEYAAKFAELNTKILGLEKKQA